MNSDCEIVKGSVFHVISLISCEISEAPRGASLAQWQSQDLPFVSSFYRDWMTGSTFWVLKEAKESSETQRKTSLQLEMACFG